MIDYYQKLKDALLQKYPNGSEPLNKLEQLKKNNDEVGIIKMYNQYKSIVNDYKPPTRFDESKKMTRESLKGYIRNEIIEMLSPEEAEETAAALERAANSAEKLKSALKEEEDEPTDAELKKSNKITQIADKLSKTSQEMKEIAIKWKKAEGEEKDRLLARLKELTKIKKDLEKLL